MSMIHQASHRETIRTIKKQARNCNVPLVILQRGTAPNLLYAESHDLASLADWAAKVQDLDRNSFKCAAPPAKAPVNSDRPSKVPGERFMDIHSTTAFSEELAKRGLINWWLDNEGFRES
ncbi:hypothetical protein E8E14_005192 [Neopestalotiopsis sp. 37M]|nr:hypothetical protein E8E14_005192 [Neopestalotiopsis sp. 37M]